MNTTTALKSTVAGKKRASHRIARRKPGGDSSARAIHAGVPSGNGPNNPPPTGPNELWWAPYDPTQVPDGPPGAGFKSGLMYGYFGATNIFKCAVEPQWQCSFAMNYSTGSPMGKRDSFVTQAAVPVVTTFHGSDTGGVAWQRLVSAVVAVAIYFISEVTRRGSDVQLIEEGRGAPTPAGGGMTRPPQ